MNAPQAVDHRTAPRIAIIGGGASGAILSLELLRGPRWFGTLTLIEKAPRVGPGLAYDTSSDAHVLNSRASTMSIASDANDFTQWLHQQGAQDAIFAKRSEFGAYLEERLAAALRSAPGVAHVVHDEAIALTPVGAYWRVALSEAQRVDAEIVVLALGNQTPALPSALGDASGRWLIRDPWDNDALGAVSPDEDVLLLGTGMTMVDVALALSPRPRNGRIFALSRRGLTPHAHDLTSVGVVRPNLPSRMSEALRDIRARAQAADEAGHSWRDVVDEIRPTLPDIWRRLPRDTRHRFLRHARPWWDIHRHRLAPYVAERIGALEQSGALTALAGKVQG
ncbi:MAG TPA: FAD/NAD(P)-binding protein, partial [Verrucomicrobiae bacterium]|nr:FAD/NAD(P)-binding protein [Verrucomicrobiae bacterium]